MRARVRIVGASFDAVVYSLRTDLVEQVTSSCKLKDDIYPRKIPRSLLFADPSFFHSDEL